MSVQVDPTSSNLATAMLNSKIWPRAVVGYGVKIFHPSTPNCVTRSPGWRSLVITTRYFQIWAPDDKASPQQQFYDFLSLHENHSCHRNESILRLLRLTLDIHRTLNPTQSSILKWRLRFNNRCNSLNSVTSYSFIRTGQFSNDCRKELCYCDCYALDLAKNLAPFFFTNRKQIQNRWQLVHVIFPAIWANYKQLLL